MKVGILTYHRAKNLGAMLQAYALQETLKKYHDNVRIIDYKNDVMERGYSINNKSFLQLIKLMIKQVILFRKNKLFTGVRDNFVKTYYKLSSKEYTINNICEANKEFDTFVVGSDQVWNMRLNYGDKTFLLDFVNNENNRYSYAASFGSSKIEDNMLKVVAEELKKFKKISVREEEGVNIISEMLPQKCSLVVLDPTMLLSPDEWGSIIVNPIIREKYIFVYLVAPSPDIVKYANELAKKNNCKVICFHGGRKRIKGFKILNKMSPNEFIGYIKNADYVLTSSFHGLCFSILMHKKFVFGLDKNKYNNNSRLLTLTKMLGVEDRNVDIIKDIETPIDYKKVDEKLKKERAKSIEYIKSIGA